MTHRKKLPDQKFCFLLVTATLGGFGVSACGDSNKAGARRPGSDQGNSVLANIDALTEDKDMMALKDLNLVLICNGKQVGQPLALDRQKMQDLKVVSFVDTASLKKDDLCMIEVRSAGFPELGASQQVVFDGEEKKIGSGDTAQSVYFLSAPSPLKEVKEKGLRLDATLYRAFNLAKGPVLSAKITFGDKDNKIGEDSFVGAYLSCGSKDMDMRVQTLGRLIATKDGAIVNFDGGVLKGKVDCAFSLRELRGTQEWDWFASNTASAELPSDSGSKAKPFDLAYTLTKPELASSVGGPVVRATAVAFPADIRGNWETKKVAAPSGGTTASATASTTASTTVGNASASPQNSTAAKVGTLEIQENVFNDSAYGKWELVKSFKDSIGSRTRIYFLVKDELKHERICFQSLVVRGSAKVLTFYCAKVGLTKIADADQDVKASGAVKDREFVPKAGN